MSFRPARYATPMLSTASRQKLDVWPLRRATLAARQTIGGNRWQEIRRRLRRSRGWCAAAFCAGSAKLTSQPTDRSPVVLGARPRIRHPNRRSFSEPSFSEKAPSLDANMIAFVPSRRFSRSVKFGGNPLRNAKMPAAGRHCALGGADPAA